MRIPKIVYRIFPAAPSSINIALSFFLDCRRFIRFNTNNRHRKSKDKHQAILIRLCHGLEKAFSLPEIKSEFGANQANALLDELDSYYGAYGDDRVVADAISILTTYARHHKGVSDERIKYVLKRISDFQRRYMAWKPELAQHVCFSNLMTQELISGADFEEFLFRRKSIRNFRAEKIPRDILLQASLSAGRSPSACNRQPWVVRTFRSHD